MPISTYSPVRDSNADIVPGNLRTDVPKEQQIVNAIRQIMADLASFVVSGTVTALSVTTLVVTGGAAIKGTATNDNAAAGDIGEYIEGNRLAGAALAITTAVQTDVTSIVLTAGDWDVYGQVAFTPAATTNITLENESISTVSATLDATPGRFSSRFHAGIVPGASANNLHMAVLMTRLSLAATTTVYLVTRANFTVAALSAWGRIWARRVR